MTHSYALVMAPVAASADRVNEGAMLVTNCDGARSTTPLLRDRWNRRTTL